MTKQFARPVMRLAVVMALALTASACETVSDTVSALDTLLVTESLDGFATLIAGRPSINTRLDALRHRFGLLDDYDRRNG